MSHDLTFCAPNSDRLQLTKTQAQAASGISPSNGFCFLIDCYQSLLKSITVSRTCSIKALWNLELTFIAILPPLLSQTKFLLPLPTLLDAFFIHPLFIPCTWRLVSVGSSSMYHIVYAMPMHCTVFGLLRTWKMNHVNLWIQCSCTEITLNHDAGTVNFSSCQSSLT